MYKSKQRPTRYYLGDLVIDGGNFLLLKGGEPKKMTPRAFEVLLCLLEQRGRLVEKSIALLEQ